MYKKMLVIVALIAVSSIFFSGYSMCEEKTDFKPRIGNEKSDLADFYVFRAKRIRQVYDYIQEMGGEYMILWNEWIAQKESITDADALSAIRNYCYTNNPDLEEIEKAGEYPVSWNIISSEEDEIVILFRSYTGAQIRYYIDPVSGDTYVTEYVPGITPEEEQTDESFNVKDYFSR